MPDNSKAKDRRRRKELENRLKVKSAPDALVAHDRASIQLLMPEGFNFIGGREDPFLQTEANVYHSDVTRDFLIKLNGRLLGPFKKHELQCLRDCLRNDVDI